MTGDLYQNAEVLVMETDCFVEDPDKCFAGVVIQGSPGNNGLHKKGEHCTTWDKKAFDPYWHDRKHNY